MTQFRLDRWLRGWLVVAILSLSMAGLDTPAGTDAPVALAPIRHNAGYGQPPISFEQNVGQFDGRAQFVAGWRGDDLPHR